MSDPCPYKCGNPDCSYRRSLDQREADEELARLRAENERLQRAVEWLTKRCTSTAKDTGQMLLPIRSQTIWTLEEPPAEFADIIKPREAQEERER